MTSFRFQTRRWGILIGDVSGKGAAAALYGALVSGMLRNLVLEEQSPKALLAAANRTLLSRKIEARYLTSLYAPLGPAKSQPRDVKCRPAPASALPPGPGGSTEHFGNSVGFA